MARGRKTTPIKSADIFARTKRASTGTRRPGRPPVHEEAWTKVTVVLFNRQIVFLDRLAANIRAQSGAALIGGRGGRRRHRPDDIHVRS